MTSSINPANINGAFPVAGQDNDSQGFRDNFTNIKSNFTLTKTEIEDLQNKTVLIDTLTGGPTGNTVNLFTSNVTMTAAKTSRFTKSVYDHGSIAGSLGIDYTLGDIQVVAPTGNVTLAFTNWPASGTYATTQVRLAMANVIHYIILPASVSIGITANNIPGYDSVLGAIKPVAVGSYLLEFGTVNGGTAVSITKLISP